MLSSCRLALASFLVLASVGGATAQIDTLLQPRGVPLSGLPGVGPLGTTPTDPIATGANANTYLGIGPPTEPFARALPAGVVRTTEPIEYYVRLYTPGSSNANGPWIMRASTVRGLTAEQLRDRFALPFLPTYITNVLVPAGTCLLNGIAGPIAGWGNGGAQQTYLIGRNTSDSCRYDFLVLGVNYINLRPLGINALWYARVVGPGNSQSVGGYLDHMPAPTEYGDLYGVYNTLDVLNDGTAAGLAPALEELTGENHANASWLALTNAERSVRGLSDHARGAFTDGERLAPLANAMVAYAAAPPVKSEKAPMVAGRWWGAGGGVFGRAGSTNERAGYRYGGGQGAVGYDWRAPEWLLGLAGAVESTQLNVEGPSNYNTITSLRLGGYGSTQYAGLTFAASGQMSWDHYVTSRDLPTFSRIASATYEGWSGALAADVSHVFALGALRLEPLAGATFVRLWRPAFTESGAGAVSLAADREAATKFASRLGATVSTALPVGNLMLRPWLRAYWAHDFSDNEADLTASFVGASGAGTFTVYSATLAYDGEWGRDASNNAVTLTALLRW